MEVFRISHINYSRKLSSSGSANRWNFDGEYVIYTGSSRSLSTLELVVHRNAIQALPNYEAMVISVADIEELYEQIPIKKLPKSWRKLEAYYKLQNIGSKWYKEQRSLVLRIPSAVIPKEYNYLINTKHPDFSSNVSLVRNEDYFFDKRLLSKTVANIS